MHTYQLGEKQQQFADIIWDNAPVSSRALAELCAGALGWKRTTTYTMLKGLCDKGIFENRGGTVVSLMSREDFAAAQGKEFLCESFGGSLPRFLTAFTRKNKLSDSDVAELQKLIDEYREGS